MKSSPGHRTDARAPEVTRIDASHGVSLRFYLDELWRRRSLVRVLSARSLKKQYEMNIVGFAWWLLEPLSLTLVYVIIVDLIFRQDIPAYALFIVIGILPWKWLSSTVVQAMATMRGNGQLITDVYFPRALLPAVELTTGLAHFLVGLAIVPPFMLVFRVAPTWHLLWLPVVIAVQFLFLLALSYPLAIWGLYYRNLVGLVQNVLRLWLYLTPIIWPLSRLDGRSRFRLFAELNPLTGIIEAYRAAILYHRSPNWTLAYSAAVGLVTLAVGIRYFVRREQQLGKLV